MTPRRAGRGAKGPGEDQDLGVTIPATADTAPIDAQVDVRDLPHGCTAYLLLRGTALARAHAELRGAGWDTAGALGAAALYVAERDEAVAS
jgi:hypothetical protein